MNVPVVRMSTTDDFPWTLDYESMESVGTFTNDQLTKKKYNTFLVFHSGNVIMSGMTKETMKDHFDCFQGMIREWRDQIEEKLKN